MPVKIPVFPPLPGHAHHDESMGTMPYHWGTSSAAVNVAPSGGPSKKKRTTKKERGGKNVGHTTSRWRGTGTDSTTRTTSVQSLPLPEITVQRLSVNNFVNIVNNSLYNHKRLLIVNIVNDHVLVGKYKTDFKPTKTGPGDRPK